jgi:FlaA1/EpsC-like NDP-sugar epimerase
MKNLKQKLIRIIADSIMINISLIIGIILNIIIKMFIGTKIIEYSGSGLKQQFYEILTQSGMIYRDSFLILTILCLIVFYLSGFYSYGRTYCSKYKALVIVQAVSISYIIFGAINYLIFPGDVFSRSVFLISWTINVLLIETSRLWSCIWKMVIKTEKKLNININTNKKDAILVIGGAGFLGSLLVRKLLKNNIKVNVLDLLLYGNTSIRDLYSYEKNLKVIKGDFRSIDKIYEAVDDVYCIVHLGGIVGDPACNIDPKLTFDVNLMATKMVAEVAKGSSINKFIFASSCSVYGASDEILNEKSMLSPLSLYAKTKLASEDLLLSMKSGNFSPLILRFATLFGLSYRPRFDLVINLFAAKAAIEKKISIFGGDQWRPFIHV